MKILQIFTILMLSVQYINAQTIDSLEVAHPIQEVIVTGNHTTLNTRLLTSTKTTIEREAIDTDNRPSLLPTLAEQVPGLFITSRGVMGYGVSTGAAGTMSIRGVGGAPTTGVMVLIDGNPQYMGLMGHPIADAYQSALAERVEVVRGPASVIYGSNAMGGVMNIITRKLPHDGSQTDLHLGYGSYNTLQTNLTNRINKGRVSSTITGSYDRSDGHRKNMNFEQYGGAAKIDVKLSERWNISTNINITHFNSSNPGTISAPLIDNDARITRASSYISLNNSSEATQGSINIYYNYGLHRINDGYSEGESPLDYRFRSQDMTTGVAAYQCFSLWNNNRTTVGADYQLSGGKALNRYLDEREDKLIVDKYMHNIAGYVNTQQSFLHWMMLDLGMRFDYKSNSGNAWVPQGGLSFFLPHNMQVKAIVSKGFRFPTIREMYMFPPQNPNLLPEQLMNYELSFNHRLRAISYGVNIFHIDGKNMIQTIMQDGRPLNVNTNKVENSGIEAEMAVQIAKRWRVMANYSYLYMKYPVLAAPEHKLFCSLRYTAKRWSAGSSIQLINGLITQREPLQKQNYLLWNADIEFRATSSIELYARAENMLNQKYEINAGFPMPGATINAGIKLHFNK